MRRISVVDLDRSFCQKLKEVITSRKGVSLTMFNDALWQAHKHLAFDPPDILIFDPCQSGNLYFIEKIRKLIPSTKIIVFTTCRDKQTLFECLRMTIDGYLMKESLDATVLNSFDSVLEGGAAVDGRVLKMIVTALHTPLRKSTKLSRREIEVLQLLVQCKTRREIADELIISYDTASTHIRSIYIKLKVGTRAEAIAQARAHHFIGKQDHILEQL